MKLFAQYLKQRWRGIAVAILFCLIFAVTFALYHLPIEAVLYPASICGALGLMLLGIDFRRVLTKHKKLERIRTIADAVLKWEDLRFPVQGQLQGFQIGCYHVQAML